MFMQCSSVFLVLLIIVWMIMTIDNIINKGWKVNLLIIIISGARATTHTSSMDTKEHLRSLSYASNTRLRKSPSSPCNMLYP